MVNHFPIDMLGHVWPHGTHITLSPGGHSLSSQLDYILVIVFILSARQTHQRCMHCLVCHVYTSSWPYCQKHVRRGPWVTEHQGDCRWGNKTNIQWGESIVLTCRWGNKTKELVCPSTGLYRQLDNRGLRRVVQTQSWNHRIQNNGNRLWSIALTQCKLTEHCTMDVASEALP